MEATHQARVRAICSLETSRNEFMLDRALQSHATPRAASADPPRSSCPSRAQIEARRASLDAATPTRPPPEECAARFMQWTR